MRSILAGFLCAAAVAAAPAPPRPTPNFIIHLTPSGQANPAQYKGKVVILALIQTTCPHCQRSTQLLSGLQKEYGPRGLQVMAAAFQDQITPTVVSAFIKEFQPNFPVGYSSRTEVLSYLGIDPMAEMYVPIMVFIDRKGMIRHQYLGDDPFYQNQEKNVRATIESLLKEPATKPPTLATKKKES